MIVGILALLRVVLLVVVLTLSGISLLTETENEISCTYMKENGWKWKWKSEDEDEGGRRMDGGGVDRRCRRRAAMQHQRRTNSMAAWRRRQQQMMADGRLNNLKICRRQRKTRFDMAVVFVGRCQPYIFW